MLKRILLIEDEAPIRFVLKDSLEQAGFMVDQAENGQVGLERAVQTRPDLLLLDVVMPKKDGMTVLRELREDQWGKAAKVILLTNILDDDEMADEARSLGVEHYLLKAEWTLKDVVEQIHQVFLPEPV